MKLSKISNLVEQYLERAPETRDNDALLIAKIWGRTVRAAGHNLKQITAFDFLKMYALESMLPNPESIRRSRQKLQELNPSLRGRSYKARKEVQELETRQELRGM